MRSLSLALVMILAGCQAISPSDLTGEWRAVSILEAGHPLDLNLEKVVLKLGPEGAYYYHGNLKQEEAGTYHLSGMYLYTLDTLNRASTEKAVEILSLKADTLALRMMENGKERKMIMTR